MKKYPNFILIFSFLFNFFSYGQENLEIKENLPLSTQLTISKANVYNKKNEVLKVFLIYNTKQQSLGTGFLIKSGQIITNAHVVHYAQNTELTIYSPNGQHYAITKFVEDTIRDLAIITPSVQIKGGFELGDEKSVDIGNQVYTWGYPFGYSGISPLLSVGYISGINNYQPYAGKFVQHLIVNGAFNPGNSGGPLIDSGKVIGVVQSKVAPLTPYILSALTALKNNSNGMIYTSQDQTGKTTQFSEAQVIEQILSYYRELSQVMIGEAVSIFELKKYLTENNISGY